MKLLERPTPPRGVSQPRGRKSPVEYKWIVLINTTIGVLMASLDNSIITISLPDILRSLNASVIEILWVVLGYSLVITALLLPLARLADMKGRVKLYNLGFLIFTLASALCGAAQTGLQLVGFRLVQGVGAALLYANSTALVTDAFPSEERGMALGVNMMAAVSGYIAGTILGGVITEFVGWRYIFFINVPIGAFAATWAFRKLHEMVEPEHGARLDVGGIITFPLAMISILGALSLVVLGEWGFPRTNGLFVAGAVLLLLFWLIETRVAEPMMDLALFRIRVFAAGNAALFLNALARGGTMFIMSWYFQAVLDDSPLIAGLKMLPLAATMMVSAPIAGRISDRIGSRGLSTAGLVLTTASMAWMGTFQVRVPYVELAAAFVLLGTGNGVFNAPNSSVVMGSVPAQRRGVAAASRTLMLNSGRTVAIALTMAIVATSMSYATLVALFAGSTAALHGFSAVSFMDGLHKVFFVGAAFGILAIVCSALQGDAGAKDGPHAHEAQIEL